MQSERQALLWICEARQGEYCHLKLGPMLKKKDFDWSNLFALAVSNGLVPLCYRNSERLIPGLMPEIVRQHFRQRYQKIARRNLQITADCQRINRVCIDENINITHFKGPTLAMQLYGDPTMRTYCDIDALVSRHDQKRLHPYLCDLGYDYKIKFTPKQYQYQLKYGKDMPYKHKTKPISIDLHWHYAYYKPRLLKLVQVSKMHAAKYSWQQFQYSSLEPHAYACYLAFHGGREGWNQLKWVIDFYHMYQQCDSGRLIKLSKELGVPRFVEHAIHICQNFFISNEEYDCSVFGVKCAALATNLIKGGHPVLNQRLLKYRLYFSLSTTIREKVHVLARCFNTTHFQWSDISLPDKLFFLYYLIRPFHWVYRLCINQKVGCKSDG